MKALVCLCCRLGCSTIPEEDPPLASSASLPALLSSRRPLSESKGESKGAPAGSAAAVSMSLEPPSVSTRSMTAGPDVPALSPQLGLDNDILFEVRSLPSRGFQSAAAAHSAAVFVAYWVTQIEFHTHKSHEVREVAMEDIWKQVSRSPASTLALHRADVTGSCLLTAIAAPDEQARADARALLQTAQGSSLPVLGLLGAVDLAMICVLSCCPPPMMPGVGRRARS